jgi:hypothetical protein
MFSEGGLPEKFRPAASPSFSHKGSNDLFTGEA